MIAGFRGPALTVLALIVSAGCSPQPPPSAQAALARAERTTLESGWRVDCVEDEVHATRRCYAGKFGNLVGLKSNDIRFQVVFYDERGPIVEPGYNTYPGRSPTVRVDENPPVYDMTAAKLIDQLREGSVALAEYHVWPEGAEQMRVNLAGFDEAYERLLRMVNKNKGSTE